MSDKMLRYQAGETIAGMAELTDSGDQQSFNSVAERWCMNGDYKPVIVANGILTGGRVFEPVSGSDDVVDYKALTLNLNGVEGVAVSAGTDEPITRGGGASTQYIINALTITAAGAVAVVVGTGAASSFSETIGAAGGPPYIPVDSVMFAQVRLSSSVSAAITSDEIFMTPGPHKEMGNNPSVSIVPYRVEEGALTYAGVDFAQNLPKIHTGNLPKKTYAQFYTPSMIELQDAYDFKGSLESSSLNSKETYTGTKGSRSTTLNAGSFKFLPNNLGDNIYFRMGQNLYFEYYDDRNSDQYILTQGYADEDTTYPAKDITETSVNLVSERRSERIIA